VDEEERFPVETVEKMAKLGIMGIPFPVSLFFVHFCRQRFYFFLSKCSDHLLKQYLFF